MGWGRDVLEAVGNVGHLNAHAGIIRVIISNSLVRDQDERESWGRVLKMSQNDQDGEKGWGRVSGLSIKA